MHILCHFIFMTHNWFFSKKNFSQANNQSCEMIVLAILVVMKIVSAASIFNHNDKRERCDDSQSNVKWSYNL